MSGDLASVVETFVTNLTRTLTRAIPAVGDPPFRILTDESGRHLSIRQEPAEEFRLTCDGQPFFDLKTSFRCTLSTTR